jgi:hypothetical protein
MEKGYVADLTYGAVMQSAWTRGDPMPRRILGGIKWSRSANTPIVTFRTAAELAWESNAPHTGAQPDARRRACARPSVAG